LDASVQRLLREYAEERGEPPDWLDSLFEGGDGLPPLIRHEPGHATHFHVRFYNPIAEETARRAYPTLIAEGRVKPPVHFAHYKVKKGDSLIRLAKRFGTTVRAIQRANGMRSTKIMARKTYKIPQKGNGRPPGAVAVPPRRLQGSADRGDSVSARVGPCAEGMP